MLCPKCKVESVTVRMIMSSFQACPMCKEDLERAPVKTEAQKREDAVSAKVVSAFQKAAEALQPPGAVGVSPGQSHKWISMNLGVYLNINPTAQKLGNANLRVIRGIEPAPQQKYRVINLMRKASYLGSWFICDLSFIDKSGLACSIIGVDAIELTVVQV